MSAAGPRVYLDWNATAPLRPEARAAMLAALDLTGNPSSVHAEGRAARAVLNRAREQVAALAGCRAEEVIFTSGATEAARLWFQGRETVSGAAIEHDAVFGPLMAAPFPLILPVAADGQVQIAEGTEALVLQAANPETGILQDLAGAVRIALTDATQALGRVPFRFHALDAEAAIVSAHKIGGPKGVGALILREGARFEPGPPAGGQERRRRGGTENLPGIAGFGAAAEAAARELEAGVWDRVARLRDGLEARLAEAAPGIIFFGRESARLPNTSCFAVPGWKGETQVMQMDLAGFAVSAGSACSSGKVAASRVLAAMGRDEVTAGSALRVSLGSATTEEEVAAFAAAWTDMQGRYAKKAAQSLERIAR